MAALVDKPGFECIVGSSLTDHNTKFIKQFNHINHSLPDLKWLEDPALDPSAFHIHQQLPDTVGLWDKHVKRPSADRNFVPSKSGSHEDKESCRTTAPSAVAALSEEKAFF